MLTEMTDRNFETIVFLSSWSPINGMREETRFYEAVAVVGGSFIALMVRLLLLALVPGFRTALQGFGIAISPIMLWLICWRAIKDYGVAVDNPHEKPSKVAAPVAQEMQAAEEAPPTTQADGAEAHTTKVDAGNPLVNGEFEESKNPWSRDSVVTALIVTACVTFCVSLSDPLNTADYLTNLQGRIGAIFGSLFAAVLAVLLGTALEFRLSDRRFLLGASVVMGLAALSSTAKVTLLFWIGF